MSQHSCGHKTFPVADSEFSSKRRQTRKEIFLSRMEQILPWQNMVEVIEPFYPKAGNGRRPYPLETMLRIHCMQHWYNLSDGAIEDALYEIASMRLFARLHESQHPGQGGAPISHHQATVRLRESQIQGVAEKR
ncbi:transposase [Escherichia coli]|nr:transposase [Escherichia coli]MCT8970108.1 transposase [Escherichia coli]